jgi:hypothetical protein
MKIFKDRKLNFYDVKLKKLLEFKKIY